MIYGVAIESTFGISVVLYCLICYIHNNDLTVKSHFFMFNSCHKYSMLLVSEVELLLFIISITYLISMPPTLPKGLENVDYFSFNTSVETGFSFLGSLIHLADIFVVCRLHAYIITGIFIQSFDRSYFAFDKNSKGKAFLVSDCVAASQVWNHSTSEGL